MTMTVSTSIADKTKLANQYHYDCLELQNTSIDYAKAAIRKARQCGDLLCEIKQELGHGHWMKWANKEFAGGSLATANRYKQISENWDKISREIDSITSVRAALRLVRKTLEAEVLEVKCKAGQVRTSDFRKQLEAAAAGLSSIKVFDQAMCFIFTDGFITTFNDEVYAKVPTGLNVTGAVNGNALLRLVKAIDQGAVTVQEGDGELLVIGKNERSGILLEKEITLPLDKIEQPKKWVRVSERFTEAIRGAVECAKTSHLSKFALTCVHIHPDRIEGCDNTHAIRFKLKTPIKKSILIRALSAARAAAHEIKEISVTTGWCHFKTVSNVIIGCKTHADDYIKMDNVLTGKGKKLAFPKDLIKAVMRAEIFTSEDQDRNYVHVSLKPGSVRIRGEGVSGWHEKQSKLDYDGPEITIKVIPDLFVKLIKTHDECELLTEDRLLFRGNGFAYVLCVEE